MVCKYPSTLSPLVSCLSIYKRVAEARSVLSKDKKPLPGSASAIMVLNLYANVTPPNCPVGPVAPVIPVAPLEPVKPLPSLLLLPPLPDPPRFAKSISQYVIPPSTDAISTRKSPVSGNTISLLTICVFLSTPYATFSGNKTL